MEIRTRKENKATIAAPVGRMDAITSPEFEKSLSDIINGGEKFVVMNFSELEYISSAGLRAVLAVAKKAKSAGGEAFVTGLGGSVEEIFKLTGFQNLLKIFPSDEDALAKI